MSTGRLVEAARLLAEVIDESYEQTIGRSSRAGMPASVAAEMRHAIRASSRRSASRPWRRCSRWPIPRVRSDPGVAYFPGGGHRGVPSRIGDRDDPGSSPGQRSPTAILRDLRDYAHAMRQQLCPCRRPADPEDSRGFFCHAPRHEVEQAMVDVIALPARRGVRPLHARAVRQHLQLERTAARCPNQVPFPFRLAAPSSSGSPRRKSGFSAAKPSTSLMAWIPVFAGIYQGMGEVTLVESTRRVDRRPAAVPVSGHAQRSRRSVELRWRGRPPTFDMVELGPVIGSPDLAAATARGSGERSFFIDEIGDGPFSTPASPASIANTTLISRHFPAAAASGRLKNHFFLGH